MGKICVELSCRLGNQMFQLAAGNHISKKYGKELLLNEAFDGAVTNSNAYTRNESILRDYRIMKLPELASENFIEIEEDRNQEFTDFSICEKFENVYLRGMCQCDRYFTYDEVYELFGATEKEKEKYIEKYGDISDYVCISVRRGDYVGNPAFVSPSPRWYEHCYHKYFEGLKIIVASDDIEWCKQNITFNNPIYIENETPEDTIKIKSLCKNHIIPPSTFSWWSAYLSKGKVVITDEWFGPAFKRLNEENKYPKGWIKEKVI